MFGRFLSLRRSRRFVPFSMRFGLSLAVVLVVCIQFYLLQHFHIHSSAPVQQQQQQQQGYTSSTVADALQGFFPASTTTTTTTARKTFQSNNVTNNRHSYHFNHSQIHCVGDNFLPSAWIYRSCEYRYLCHKELPQDDDSNHGGWFLVASPHQKALSERVRSWKNKNPHSFPSLSTLLSSTQPDVETSLQVSPIVTHPSYVRQGKYMWAPQVISTNSFSKKIFKNRTVIPIYIDAQLFSKQPSGSSIINNNINMHGLLTRILLPLFQLVRLFQDNLDNENKDIDVYILNPQDCLDAATTCWEWLRWGMEHFLGFGLLLSSSSSSSSSSSTNLGNETFTCWERGMAGMGMLSTDHGLSRGGSHAKDYREPAAIHNAGKGATLWEFHNWMVEKRLSAASHNKNKNDNQKKEEAKMDMQLQKDIQVTLAASYNTTQTLLRRVQDFLHPDDNLKTNHHQDGPKLNIRMHVSPSNTDEFETIISRVEDTIRLAQGTNVWIAVAMEDESTWPVFFLPRGSMLILLFDPSQHPKGNQNHAIYSRFGTWNHISHVKVQWIPIPRNEKEHNAFYQVVKQLIRSQQKEAKGSSQTAQGTKTAFDGTFQKYPVQRVTDKEPPVASSFHCLGTNFEWDAPNYQSCYIQNMCWDGRRKEFVLRKDSDTIDLSKTLHSVRAQYTLSTHWEPSQLGVMLGQSVRLGNAEPWFPKPWNQTTLRPSPQKDESYYYYYSLPPNLLWLPYYAEVPNADNPGHLLWDFLLPMYTLLEMYFGPPPIDSDHLHTGRVYPRLLVTNIDSDCVEENTKHSCYKLTRKFMPLMGVNPDSFANVQNLKLKLPNNHVVENSTPLVCAHHAAMGIGMLTDHGVKKHGQLLWDYQTVRNVGRGIAFWRFRNWMLENALGSSKVKEIQTRKHQRRNSALSKPMITFSVNSSNNPSRRRDFAKVIRHLEKDATLANRVQIQAIEFGELSLEEQLEMLLESSILVSVMGGSASTAMFLDRHASLILCFSDDDEIHDMVKDQSKRTRMPARLDWDFWNHASYLHAHWFPLSFLDGEDAEKTREGLDVFIKLIEIELESLW